VPVPAERTRAIMRALKATAPAQTGGFSTVTAPSISPGPSPLVASYGEWTSGRSYGTNGALPRDPATFLSGMFGPLAPIRPIPVDTPEPGEDRPEPRRLQYPVGWDMPMGMPGTEGWGKLADFQTLRTLADLYSVARACIDLRKAELRGIGWDIALTKDAAKSLRGSHSGMADFSKRREEAVKFFRRPDPNYSDFSSWFDTILEEIFVTDALAVYVQPSMGKKKGLLGSNVAALDLIDGALIRPLVDIRGGRPPAPNPAYQQFLYGVPRVDLMTLLLGEDSPEEEGLIAEYSGDQLMYLPYNQRAWTVYGQAPIERAIIPVMTGLNKQGYQLNFFQEGTIPGLFISPGDVQMTPAQIRELQDALNSLAGDQAWKHKIIVLPGGSKVDPQKPVPLADQFDEIIMTQVCMAFQVMPMELGISPRVSATQSTGAANQMAKASQDIQERKGVVPLLLWLKSSIFDTILQKVCGQPDLEWQWEGLEEDEDAETLTNLLVQQVSAGMRSIDEARQELGLDPWGLPITSDPGWANQMGGFVPLTAIAMTPPPVPQPGQGTQANSQNAPGRGQQYGSGPGQAPTQQRQAPGNQPRGVPALPQSARSPMTAPAPGRGPGVGTPAHSGANATGSKKPAGKSQSRELDLLRNHLHKGGTVAGWTPVMLPGHVLAAVDEDLSKGLSADEAIAVAKGTLLGKGHTEVTTYHGHGDLTHHVYAYLGRHYPASVLEWVKTARWHGPVEVKLKKIDMARRPGGARDETRVDLIARRVADGQHLDPVVLVRTPDGSKLQIADGWHRTLALKHEGQTRTLAWVGDVDADHGPWDKAMNRAKLNKAAGEHAVMCGRGHEHHGQYGAAGMLIRHKGDDGQVRYLLHKRSSDGNWDLPGGALHEGEAPEAGARREAGEELGELPGNLATHHVVTDDHGNGWAYTTVVADSPDRFSPSADGGTPDETAGWAWLTAAEVADLPLDPGFAATWDMIRRSRSDKAGGARPKGVTPAGITTRP
jgi:8-oxo-dGTP pyrophosphatase MutT (NUDIX family)